MLEDALAVEAAGSFALLLELVVAEVAQTISERIAIPTIGIGSGAGCDGQVLVSHDLIGLFPWFTPKFVTQRGHVADEIRNAASAYIAATKKGLVLDIHHFIDPQLDHQRECRLLGVLSPQISPANSPTRRNFS